MTFQVTARSTVWLSRPGRADDIHGPVAPFDVVTVATPSDHLAVVATYA